MSSVSARDTVNKPRHLGHMLSFTTDMNAKIDFYTRILGMSLAGDKPGFHHAGFEVASIDEVGLGGCQMIAKGHRNGWGLGRHVIGSNFFHYIRDPWNGLAEYFCDIDYIPTDMEWRAKDWPMEDSLYVWGPDVPEDFPVKFEEL